MNETWQLNIKDVMRCSLIKKTAKKLFRVLCGFPSRPKKGLFAARFSLLIYYFPLKNKRNR